MFRYILNLMSINVNIMTVTYDIKCLQEYQIISVQNFQDVNSQQRVLINDSIEKNYLKDPLSKGHTNRGYNFPLYDDHTLFFSYLYEKYKTFCYELFGSFHLTIQNNSRCWCYRSNINDSNAVWHDHLYTSTINGVYYYQVEKDGIFFESQGKEFYYVPQQGELLIFPHDLNHKPDIATSANWRYSINMEIITEESASTLFKNYGLS